MITCPKCGELTPERGYSGWQIVIAILFFPIGLLALLADKEPTKCEHCSHSWNV